MSLDMKPKKTSVQNKEVKWSESRSVVPSFLWPHWNSPGQNTGVGSHSLLQGIFPSQGLNWGLLHCRWILYQLSHRGSPRIPEWAAYPFSSGCSRTRNWTGVSCIAGEFFTSWAVREALREKKMSDKKRNQPAATWVTDSNNLVSSS